LKIKTTELFLYMGNSRSVAAFADESQYKYQAPGPNDSRSPCPALNALANHGYLPRDGKDISPDVLQRALQVNQFIKFEGHYFLSTG
jgi:hypothetical protein